ncbi:hypothetical protein AVEN_46806-2-1, partial [Araneus ventricosus]
FEHLRSLAAKMLLNVVRGIEFALAKAAFERLEF